MSEQEKATAEHPSGQDDINSVEDVLDLRLKSGQDTKDNGEHSEEQDKVVESEQPTEYELEKEEYEKLTSELGYQDEDLNNLTREQVNEILQNDAKKEKPSDEVDLEAIITPKLAEKYGGVAKNFINKPLGELIKALQESTSYVGKLKSDLQKYEKEFTKHEKAKIDELEKELKTAPDLTEEEFAKKIDELAELKAEVKMRASQPDPDRERQEAEFFQTLQTNIPQGMDSKQVFSDWANSLTSQQKDAYAKSDPLLTYQAIVQHASLQNIRTEMDKKIEALKTTEKNKERDIKLKVATEVKNAIRKSNGQSVKGSKFTIVDRTTKDRYEGMDSVVADILRDER